MTSAVLTALSSQPSTASTLALRMVSSPSRRSRRIAFSIDTRVQTPTPKRTIVIPIGIHQDLRRPRASVVEPNPRESFPMRLREAKVAMREQSY